MSRILQTAVAPAIAVVLLFIAPSAHPCSAPRLTDPNQLVAQADGIYVVRAPLDEQAPLKARQAKSTLLRFEVLETIKGALANQLDVDGALLAADDFNDGPVPYDFVRPGGRRGSCFAESYGSGRTYLLMLKNGTPYWAVLGATNEQVSGPQDPWVLWVKAQLQPAHAL